MKKYQFEEFMFWLSLIAAFTAYLCGFVLASKIIGVVSAWNLGCAIREAYKHVKLEGEE